jgi:ATP-binding cassette subfamily B protein
MPNLTYFWTSARTFSHTFMRVIRLAWSVSPGLYLGQLVLNVLTGLAPVISAYLAGAVVAQLASSLAHSGADLVLVYKYVIALAVIQLLSNQFQYLLSYLESLYNLKFDGYIWENLLTQYGRLDQTYYDDSAFNNKFNKIVENIFSIRMLSSQSFSLLANLVEIVATAIALATLQPWLVIIVLVALGPVILIEASASLKRWRYWDSVGEDFRLQSYLRSTLTNSSMIREVKLYGIGDWLMSRWRQSFEMVRGGQVAIARKAEQQRGIASLIDAFMQLGIQLWLIHLVVGRGVAGIGQFVFYRQVISNFVNAGSSSVRIFQQMQDNTLYVNDYFEFQSLVPRLIQPDVAKKLNSDEAIRIEFKDVSFRYPGAKNWAIRRLNLTIEPGSDVAIIGDNGAGKTTFVKLLMRLYDPAEGAILINGIDLRELDINSWSKRIGVLFQDFNKYGPLSLSENIQMGRISQEPDNALLMAALNKAGGNDLINDLSKGLNQTLTNNFADGVDLSGGQWQRVALARAFYRDAPILVLDEPTSAIDARGEYKIFEEISRVQANKTTIIISHRFSTVRNANSIIVFNHGQITESGDHESLMALGGRYHDLFELQATGYR